MLYVIYNKDTGEILKAPARSVGMWIRNYKSEPAAKAALTRLDKKGKLGERRVWNAETQDFDTTVYVKEDFKVADVDTFREEFPVKMVERVNLMSGKTYLEAEDTPNYCSPSSEAYWSM